MPNRKQQPVDVKTLEAPPLSARVRPARAEARKVRLRQLSRRKNKITDSEAWFKKSGLVVPSLKTPGSFRLASGSVPDGLPLTFDGETLREAFPQPGGNRVLAVYGPDFVSGRLLVAWDEKAQEVRYAFDLENYRTSAPGKGALMGLNYAREQDGILYLISDAQGYAKEHNGKNGYVTALEVPTGRLLWRSAPLTANSRSLEIVGPALFCGYGFTAESDFLYSLDRETGAVLQKVPIASAPEYLIVKGRRLYVRCYDTDYEFAISGV